MASLVGGGFRGLVGGGKGLKQWIVRWWRGLVTRKGGCWGRTRGMAGVFVFLMFSWFDCGQRDVLVMHKVSIMGANAPRARIKVDDRRTGGVTMKDGVAGSSGRSPLRRCLTPAMVNMHLVLSRQIEIIGVLSTPITLLQCPDRPSVISAFSAAVCLCFEYLGRCGPLGNTRGRNVNSAPYFLIISHRP